MGKIIRNPGIIFGTQTNDVPGAGQVGEELKTEVLSGASVALSTGAAKTIASLNLTPGDWEIRGAMYFLGVATTSITVLTGSISETTDVSDLSTPGRFYLYRTAAFVLGATSIGFGGLTTLYRITSPTTLYLVANATFTAAALSGYGVIRGRRVR